LQYIKSKEQLSHTKVVFLTAKNRASDMEKGLAMGADKYLTKPFSVKKVVAEIQELLE
jgi:DNA-binding response OmpR family regulator